MLEHYERIYPGATKRIFDAADTQAAHRQEIEKSAVNHEFHLGRFGIGSGLIVSLLSLGGAITCILAGHDWAGAALGTVDLAALAGVFVYGSRARRQERIQKAQVMAGGAAGEATGSSNQGSTEGGSQQAT